MAQGFVALEACLKVSFKQPSLNCKISKSLPPIPVSEKGRTVCRFWETPVAMIDVYAVWLLGRYN